MIVGIFGLIIKKEPNYVYIKTSSGLVYQVFTSFYTSSKLEKNHEVYLHTTYIVKEDSQKLFGFFEEKEKEIFDRVLKVNGVGPSIALAICSTLSPDRFIKALQSQNLMAFKRVPGIGPKSAKRLLVELSDFAASWDMNLSKEDEAVNKAVLALESLGFKRDAILKVLNNCKSATTEELIKEALKQLK